MGGIGARSEPLAISPCRYGNPRKSFHPPTPARIALSSLPPFQWTPSRLCETQGGVPVSGGPTPTATLGGIAKSEAHSSMAKYRDHYLQEERNEIRTGREESLWKLPWSPSRSVMGAQEAHLRAYHGAYSRIVAAAPGQHSRLARGSALGSRTHQQRWTLGRPTGPASELGLRRPSPIPAKPGSYTLLC